MYNSVNRIFPLYGPSPHCETGFFVSFDPMEESQDTQQIERYKVLSNGAVYDMQLKRIVSGAALTSDSARALVEKRVARRRETVRSAANENPKAAEYRERFGDFAWLAAVTNSLMVKATNPADPKATEAARWLQEATGEIEKGESAGDSTVNELRGLVKDIADLARAINSTADPRVEVGPEVVTVESVDI